MSTRRSPRLIVGMLALAGLVVSMGQSLFLPVMPDLPQLLGVSGEAASWLITITLMAGAVAIPTISRLADMYGKRRMIVLTLAIVAVGSVVGALGESFTLVMVSRALQGVGLALIPVGTSIMRDELPRERLGAAVALMSATLGIGSAAGMPLSGIIYMHLGWHALFWVSAVLAVLLLVGVLVIVPESPIRTGGRFDIAGAILLSGLLVALLLGITKGGHWGWTSSATLACFGTMIVLLAVWIPWELRNGQPVVDLRASAIRPVLLTNIISLLAGFAMYMNWLTATSQLQLPEATGYGFGASTLQAGLFMLPAATMMIIVSPMSAVITRSLGARATLIIGSAILALGYIVRVFLVASAWQIMIGTVVVSIGTAITYSALPVMIMRSVPVTETAAANGLNTVVRSIGTASASAAAAAVLTTVTLTFGGELVPAPTAFVIAHLLAAAAATCAALVAVALPRRSAAATEEARAPALNHEGIVHGYVVDAEGAPAAHAMVRVRTKDDPRVDWSLCDENGEFAVAVPLQRSYEIVAQGGEHGDQLTAGSPDDSPAADGYVVVVRARAGLTR